MEFLLTATSGPVDRYTDKATLKKYTKVEVRTVKTFSEFDDRFGKLEGTWLSKGINHKEVNGCIQREFPLGAEGYFIEINTLEELENLRLECGEELVLTTSPDYQDIPCIEIYNDYRE